jgi:hypothetical protein
MILLLPVHPGFPRVGGDLIRLHLKLWCFSARRK